MARASTVTLLSLDRFAQIMGIVPAHFNQGVSSDVFPLSNRCSDVWYQHPWQSADQVSREDLALEIANAEQDLADLLGWWPGPTWIAQETHPYPQFYRPEYYGVRGLTVRGGRKTVQTKYAKVILPGQRAVSGVDTGVAVVYSDEDSDGFDETVTITVNNVTLTNECEIKVYFAGMDGDPAWEIRPARTKTLSGGTLTVTFWAWQLLDPDLWETIPTLDFTAIDLDVAGNYVTTVDVYREYTSVAATSAVFYWVPVPGLCTVCDGTGCTACQLSSQGGCLQIMDAERGIVVPGPATYNSTDGIWEGASYATGRDPDQVKLYYYSGHLDNRYLQCQTCEPLSNWWAQTIAYLATARLERPFCNCGNTTALGEHLRVDLSLVGETSRTVPFELLGNPLGTRRGEVIAWQRVSRITQGRKRGAVAI